MMYHNSIIASQMWNYLFWQTFISCCAQGGLRSEAFKKNDVSVSSASSSRQIAAIPSWDSPNWKTVLEWDLGTRRIVRFLRAGDKFMQESDVNGKKTREPFEQPTNETPLSPQQIISRISKRQPYVNEDGTVDFLIKSVAKSKLNDQTTIDESNWGVTLIDSGRSNLHNARSLGGHAVVVIEKFENGIYQMWRGDLLDTGKLDCVTRTKNVAKVRFSLIDNTEHDSLKNYPRSETFVRTKSLVQRMIDQMIYERDNKNTVFFDYRGGDVGKGTYNCLEWAKRRMFLAGIDIPFRISDIFISLPRAVIGPSKNIIGRVEQVVSSGFGRLGSIFVGVFQKVFG